MLEHKIDLQSLAALPHSSGVYLFKGDGHLPLYIGKSVDIRARVLSHLRSPDETRLIAQTRKIEFIETSGEIGALLLESRLIKTQNPIFNQRLRRSRTLFSIRLNQQARGLVPQIVDGQSVNLGLTPGLYGLFTSAHSASQKLRQLAQQNLLCQGLLGLEKTSKRGCFGLQIKTCLGVCVGKEDRQSHDQRLFSALLDSQVEVWPFSGPIDLIETCDGWVQKHRVHRWCYLGTHCSKTGVINTIPALKAREFDLDSYKILVKPIMLQTVKIEVLPMTSLGLE